MKIVGLFILVTVTGVVLSCGVGGSKLSTPSVENMTDNTSDLEKLSGLKMPASARILSAINEGGHDGTKYKRWIILSAERPRLAGTIIEGDDNTTFVETLKEAMPNESIGKPVSSKYQFSDWKNEQGGWQAAAVETDKGFYLNLENIVLN